MPLDRDYELHESKKLSDLIPSTLGEARGEARDHKSLATGLSNTASWQLDLRRRGVVSVALGLLHALFCLFVGVLDFF